METMNFVTYAEEKIYGILFQLFFISLTVFVLTFSGVHSLHVFLIAALFCFLQMTFLVLSYRKKRKENKRIEAMVDGLTEKYYIAEILEKPKELQNEAYYYALKKACKAMNDCIGKLREENREYREYVECFAHEIKAPIGALSLTFDNNKDYHLKKETDKIYRLVEQMLYYARSENTEKDYFIKELHLEEVVHDIILKFRHYLLEKKVSLQIYDVENVVYTDEKWLHFILSQIVQNAIKYFDKDENCLTIYSKKKGNGVILVVKDNGCGLKKSEIGRAFEKGFTGSNRKKENATGMGLYLVKRLCERLGLEIGIESEEGMGTEVWIEIVGRVQSL